MSIALANPLPAFAPEDDRYVPLPLHVMSTETHACVHCGQAPIWDTYTEYLEDWWTNEYEGDRHHAPDEEPEFDYFASTCLAVAA